MPIASVTPEDEDDSGLVVKHDGFDETEFVRLRTVLSDDILEAATEKANKTGKFVNRTFVTHLILGMVLDMHVIDARTGKPYERTVAGIQSMPTQFRQWLQGEINRCDGSVAHLASIEINGVKLPFRKAA